MSAMRSSTIGRSPEMPMGQSPGCPPAPRRMVSEEGRNVGPAYSRWPAMRWNRPGFACIDAKMMELHLRLRPRQRGRPFECGGIAMLVDKVEHRLAGCGNHRPEGDAHGGARCDANAAAQCEDRIEYRADRVGQGPTVGHRDRRTDAVAAAKETGTVGFHLGLPHRLAIHDGQMRRPDFLLCRRTSPPRCQQVPWACRGTRWQRTAS